MELATKYERQSLWPPGLDHCLYVVKAKSNDNKYLCREISYTSLTLEQRENFFDRLSVITKMDCPYVVRISETIHVEEEHKYYILYPIMQTLREARKLRSPSTSDIHATLMQLIKALVYLHNSKKPESHLGVILSGILTPDKVFYRHGQLSIVDYAILEPPIIDSLLIKNLHLYSYIPSEILQACIKPDTQSTWTTKADLWSLGSTVYEYSTGSPLLASTSVMDAYNESMNLTALQSLPQEYEKNIRPILTILLSPIPGKRLPAMALQNNPKITSAPRFLYLNSKQKSHRSHDSDPIDCSSSNTICAYSISSDLGELDVTRSAREQSFANQDDTMVSDVMTTITGTAITSLPINYDRPKEALAEQWTDMMVAARNNDRRFVKKLMQRYSTVVDTAGRTALMHAAICGHSGIAKLLAKAEGKKFCTERGWTALMYAASYDNVDICKVLCKYEGGLMNDKGFTALMIAAQQNSHNSVAVLIGKESRLRDNTGTTALMMAVRAGYREIVRQLHILESQIQNNDGYFAVHIAAEENRADMLPLLIRKEKLCKAPGGLTALHVAALNDSTDAVRYLVPSLHSIKTDQGYTALMLAAIEDLPDTVELLIKEEGGLRDNEGCTAMMHAAKRNIPGVLYDLLPSESRLTDSSGCTALHLAVMANAQDCIRVLAAYEQDIENLSGRKPMDLISGPRADELKNLFTTAIKYRPLVDLQSLTTRVQCEPILTDLMKAVKACSISQAREFLHQTGKFSTIGYTALSYAAMFNYVELAALLLKQEAGLQAPLPKDDKDKAWEGCTALMVAAWYGHAEVAKLLLPLEAKLQRRDGRTALMLAAIKGHTELIKLLLPLEVGMKDRKKCTALALAAQRGNLEAIKLLAVPEARIPTRKGFSALMFAVQEGHTKSVAYLVKYESGMQLKNGQTALMSAASRGFIKCVTLLLPHEKGMQRNDGYTALMSACKHDHIAVIHLLLEHERHLKSKDGRGPQDFARTNAARDALKDLCS